MTKKDILNYLSNHKKEYEVEAIGLFGSYASAEATRESDIDILVQMKVDIIRNHKYIKPFLLKMI